MTVWVYSTKLSVREELSRELEAIGVPNYFNLETAVKALGIAARYARVKSQLNNEPG
jgi:acyl-CoA synthetase (NDP forming)